MGSLIYYFHRHPYFCVFACVCVDIVYPLWYCCDFQICSATLQYIRGLSGLQKKVFRMCFATVQCAQQWAYHLFSFLIILSCDSKQSERYEIKKIWQSGSLWRYVYYAVEEKKKMKTGKLNVEYTPENFRTIYQIHLFWRTRASLTIWWDTHLAICSTVGNLRCIWQSEMRFAIWDVVAIKGAMVGRYWTDFI